MTRCNCDASCGENRYHDVGSSGCRFNSEEEYDSYWRNRAFPKAEKKEVKMDDIEKLQSMERPWGSWHVLERGNGYKVKRLEILPDQAITLQYHNHRTETWTVVQGEGKVVVDGNIFAVKKGDTFFVPKQSLHKVTNNHLKEIFIAIEVQIGDRCEEGDIVRC